jgi:sulfur relay (sulfurtransferase) DsrF/TusC family protein
MMTLRAENRILTLKILTRYQDEKEFKQKSLIKDRIKEEDLILVKNKVRDNQKKKNWMHDEKNSEW